MRELSLYIHAPWCIQKCPYCDFNSHKRPDALPESAYVQALLADLREDCGRFGTRTVQTVFMGGGTPSLFSADAWQTLFAGVRNLLPLAPDAEITMEANPGSADIKNFEGYRKAGINRLSLGIQSFNTLHLKTLGRVHDAEEAERAIAFARAAGFTNINLDIMHGLPGQTLTEGLDDLKRAIDHAPEHLSWYALTIEPNTLFHKQKPVLPDEEILWQLEEEGLALLASAGYRRYEISAFSREGFAARHNLNYWRFGDYLGIGAGAHGKFTDSDNTVWRTQKHRQPKDYLHPEKPFLTALEQPDAATLLFEFMLNTTRLEEPVPLSLFTETTGLANDILLMKLIPAEQQGLLSRSETHWQITPHGRRFTNDLQALFLP